MKKLATNLGISILLLLSSIFLGRRTAAISGLSAAPEQHVGGTTPMHKVQLTQKGYIQVRAETASINVASLSFVRLSRRNLVISPRNMLR